MNTFKQYLTEARLAPLYHATYIKSADLILKENVLNAGFPDQIHPGKTKSIISTTRSLPFALKWNHESWKHEGVVLELDQQKLAQRYRIVPFSYFGTEKNILKFWSGKKAMGTPSHKNPDDIFGNQYEEAIITKQIRNIDKYITRIIITENDLHRASTSKYAHLFQSVLNHPLLFDINKKQWVNK